MLRHFLVLAFRSLRRQKGYAALNVLGLGLGLACCFLIVLFVQHERSFDRYHAAADRSYLLTVKIPTFDREGAATPAGLAPQVEENVAGVERTARLAQRGAVPVRVGESEIHTVGPTLLAEPGLFDAMTFRVLAGDPSAALAGPQGAVLTESTARLLFGEADPVGEPIVLTRQDITLTVGAVVADLPDNTHLDFGMLVSFQTLPQFFGPESLASMTNWSFLSYVVLREGTAPGPVAEEAAALVAQTFEYEDGAVTAHLRPVPSLHFDTEIGGDWFVARDPRALWMFGVIGGLILLIACVNFTNLATARASRRAREVGVRKSLGSGRGPLVAQFLGESLLLSLLAVGVGLAGVALALPVFNEALGGAVAFDLGHPGLLAALAGIGLLAGLIAGGYPALVLTHFQPARVLKGDLRTGGAAPTLRKGLVVFQFAASAFLLVATLTVLDQLRFMRSQALGFAQEQVVTFPATPGLLQQSTSFKASLLSDAAVVGATMANGLPGAVHSGSNFLWPGGGDEELAHMARSLVAEPDYLETVGLELAEGRWFREGEADALDAYVLNETAVREMGIENPVGHVFRQWDREPGIIIGVVEDFHFEALQQPIEPLVMTYRPGQMGDVAVRLAPGAVSAGLAHVRETFARAAPGYPLAYRFLDEGFAEQYRDEERLSTLLGFFAGVAIFIACLGIFGLAAHAAERRRKEVGVRKVLGASVRQLAALLVSDFVVLVGVALALAAPLAYAAMDRWLEGFAYAVPLGPSVFALAGCAVLLVAVLTVGTQAVRAAAADPVRALRAE